MISELLCTIPIYIALFVGINHQEPWEFVFVYWVLLAFNNLKRKRGKKDE